MIVYRVHVLFDNRAGGVSEEVRHVDTIGAAKSMVRIFAERNEEPFDWDIYRVDIEGGRRSICDALEAAWRNDDSGEKIDSGKILMPERQR